MGGGKRCLALGTVVSTLLSMTAILEQAHTLEYSHKYTNTHSRTWQVIDMTDSRSL